MQYSVLVLDDLPNQETAQRLASGLSEDLVTDPAETELVWSVSCSPPDWVDTWVIDQLEAFQRDRNVCFLTVILCTEDEFDNLRYEGT